MSWESLPPVPQVEVFLVCRGRRLRRDQNLLKLRPPWTAPGLKDPEGIARLPRDLRRQLHRGWDSEEAGPGSQDQYDQEGWRYPRPVLDLGDELSSLS